MGLMRVGLGALSNWIRRSSVGLFHLYVRDGHLSSLPPLDMRQEAGICGMNEPAGGPSRCFDQAWWP